MIDVHKMGGALGAEVTGVDLSGPLDAAAFERLLEHGIVDYTGILEVVAILEKA